MSAQGPATIYYLLLVEDNPIDRKEIEAMLAGFKEASFSLTVTGTLHEALRSINLRPPDLVLLDLNLPDSKGLQTLTAVARKGKTRIIVISGMTERNMARDALRQGATDYFVKGKVDAQLLGRAILRALMEEQGPASRAG